MPEKTIPRVSRKESFLDSKEMAENPVRVFEKYRKEHGHTFTFYFGGARRTIVSANPEFIQHVLKTNQENYQKSDIQVKRMAEFQGKGLLNSHGEFWLKQRRLLSKGFSHSHLARSLPLQLGALNEFMSALDREIAEGKVDVYHQMVKFTLRFVGKALFGSMMKDGEIDRLGEIISTVQAFMVKQIVRPYLVPWYRISGQTAKFQKLRREGDRLVMNYVDQRRREGSKEADMLQLILETPYNTGEFMEDDQVMIEILQLLVAGNETSSNALSWTFYLLARNPAWIEKIRVECETAFGSGPVTYEGLHKLGLTTNVLNEALRLYPPFWMIDRVAVNDDQVGGIPIPAGTVVVPYIYGVHHNAEVWDNPEIFDPSRFERAASGKRHPFAHIPFGGGPRVCIGQNMALMQILLVMISVIRKYNFRLSVNEAVDIHPMMILRPAGPIKMDFEAV
jgi:cytochrome P450